MAGENFDSKGWGDIPEFDNALDVYGDGQSFDPEAVSRLMDPNSSPLIKGTGDAGEMWLRAAGRGGLTLEDKLRDSRFGIFGQDKNA